MRELMFDILWRRCSMLQCVYLAGSGWFMDWNVEAVAYLEA